MNDHRDLIEGLDQRASATLTVVGFAALHGNKATGTIEILDFSLMTEEIAVPSGTITYGTPDNGDTVIFTDLPTDGTVTFTKAAVVIDPLTEFSTIAELTALIDGLDDLGATDNGTVITITVSTGGTEMNDATVTGTGTFSALSLTFSGGQDHAVIEVDGDNYTEGTDFDAETSNTVTATNLAAAIDGGTNDVDAAAVDEIVTVTAEVLGEAGNAITMSVDSGDENSVELSGATLEGGTDAATFTIDNTVFTETADWDAEDDNETTAANIAAAIVASVETVDAAVDDEDPTIVHVYWETPGTVGNTKALASSDEDNLAISGDTLEGGVAVTYTEPWDYQDAATMESQLVVSNKSGTITVDVTPYFSMDEENWIAGTAFTQLTNNGTKDVENTKPLGSVRYGIVLGGTNPTCDISIYSQPRAST